MEETYIYQLQNEVFWNPKIIWLPPSNANMSM